MRFFSYKDPEENTREQIRKVRSQPWISKDVPVRDMIFDVDTGRLCKVKELEDERAASTQRKDGNDNARSDLETSRETR
jgi:hypothetical protein